MNGAKWAAAFGATWFVLVVIEDAGGQIGENIAAGLALVFLLGVWWQLGPTALSQFKQQGSAPGTTGGGPREGLTLGGK